MVNSFNLTILPYLLRSIVFLMNKFIFSLVLASSIYFLASVTAFAAVSCQPIYGGGQTCVQSGNVLINKTVQNPLTGVFVDNLGVNDPHFSPDQTINFQISVTNTGGQTLPRVTVQDVLPKFVQFVSGVGSFDQNANTIAFDVLNLNPNETRTFSLTGKIVPVNQLPADSNVICDITNTAIATVDGQTQDIAKFCLQTQQAAAVVGTTTKGGLKVFPASSATTTPATGPELLPLIGLLPTGAFGFLLRRKSSNQ